MSNLAQAMMTRIKQTRDGTGTPSSGSMFTALADKIGMQMRKPQQSPMLTPNATPMGMPTHLPPIQSPMMQGTATGMGTPLMTPQMDAETMRRRQMITKAMPPWIRKY